MFKKNPIKIFHLFFILLIIGCSNQNTDSKTNSDIETKNKPIENNNNSEYKSNDDENDVEKDDDSEDDNGSGCKYSDGTHSATVYYYNPETGTRSTYTLNVEVENCEITQIDFPNGGYLDDCHIEPTALDSNGEASIEDDKGRKFEVHIDD